MRKALSLILIISLTFSAQSQNAIFSWAKSFGGTSADEGVSTVTDPSGNVYIMGIFNNTIDMDPGPGTYNLTSAGQADVFITKLDPLGNFIWAKQIGNSFNDNCRSMNIDVNGDLYLTGLFYSTVDFDPGPAIFNLTCSTTGTAAFLLKLDPGGNFIWAKKLIETDYGNSGYSVTAAQSGNVYVTGIFQGSGDFDPGPGVFTLSSTGTSQDIFISKFDNNGNFIWAKQFSGPNGEVPHSIVVDALENVYTTGPFYGTCDFDPGPAIFNLTANNTNGPSWSDAFIVKLDMNGNFIFAKQVSGEFNDDSFDMGLDLAGNIIITGMFSGITDFDPGSGTHNLNAGSYSDSYVLKLDNAGNFGWVAQFESVGAPNSTSRCFSIATDIYGNVYTAGDFYGGVDFDPGGQIFTLNSFGMADTYISKLGPTGNFIFAKQLGGSNFTEGISIFVDPQRNILVTGNFVGTSDFDPSTVIYNLTANGPNDAFILKLSQCLETSSALTITACNSYTLNNQTYTSSGTYTQTLINSDGCDSIITLYLTIGGTNSTSNVTACDSYFWEGQSYSSSGFYTRTYTDINNCDSILNLNLIINFSVSSNINAVICEGQSYAGHTTSGTYTDIYVGANGCDSIRTLNLIVNSRTFSTVNATICEGLSFGGHTVSGTYTDTLVGVNGCDSIRTLFLIVNPRKFTTVNAKICEGQTYVAGGGIQTISGVYRDTLQTYLGCDSIITTTLLVNAKPKPDLGLDKNICAGSTFTFSPGSYNSYLWQDMSTLPTFTTNTTGLYWVKVTDNNNCSASDSIRINTINPLPSNFLKKTDSICPNEKLLLQPLGNYLSYQWSTGSTQTNITIQAAGKYWLRVADVNGCIGLDTISVTAKSCFSGIFIPNTFTPNGDGKNDIFKAIVYGNILSFHLQIFDRYGHLVYQTTNHQLGWDGIFKGKPYSSNVFVWQCTYQMEGRLPNFEKGTVTLLR